MYQPARTARQLGAMIRRMRNLAGLSQTALGEQAGVRQETVSRVENGHASTRIDTVLDLLAALDLEIEIRPRQDNVARVEDIF